MDKERPEQSFSFQKDKIKFCLLKEGLCGPSFFYANMRSRELEC